MQGEIEGVEDGREWGGRWDRRKFKKLKRKENIYAIRWEMGDGRLEGGIWVVVRPCSPLVGSE